MSSPSPPPVRLDKQLGLVDVYAISTGAMFSSGFFLLPGLAAAGTGASVSLAYLVAGVFILPAMFAVAELSTAMPRAGGAYYFLDRSMGALVGTVGGLGTWVALILKSAFALIGMGAYLALVLDLPIKPLAVALTVVFAVVNIVGAKETSGLQRVLVFTLLGILAYFLAAGLFEVVAVQDRALTLDRFEPLFLAGTEGLFATVGLVFVSFAGLTKVASVAEEVRDPDRNLPLGMILSLATATVVYVLGALVMSAVLEPEAFHRDLTPVASAGEVFLDQLPGSAGLILVVTAAIAAFASTGNAGILSASRYPLAMARDDLVPAQLARLGRFRTPTLAIAATATLMIAFIAALDVAALAKLASAAQLMLFAALNLAVIVMREAHIDFYRPGYRAPLYPWMQVAGLVIPLWLIAQMGWTTIGFTAGFSLVFLLWFRLYARARVIRSGAIFHVFQRLGRSVYYGLDHELRGIVSEKGLHEEDPFEEVVAGAVVLDMPRAGTYRELLDGACLALSDQLSCPAEDLVQRLLEEARIGLTPISNGVALPHLRLHGVDRSRLVFIRSAGGVDIEIDPALQFVPEGPVRAVILLVSPTTDSASHLRILAQLASRIDDEAFLPRWFRDDSTECVKEAVLRDDRFAHLHLVAGGAAAGLIGRKVGQAGLPEGSVVALLRRRGEIAVPSPRTVLREGDTLTVIGDPEVVETLHERFGGTASQLTDAPSPSQE